MEWKRLILEGDLNVDNHYQQLNLEIINKCPDPENIKYPSDASLPKGK